MSRWSCSIAAVPLAAVLVLLVVRYGLTLHALAYAALACVLGKVTVVDLRTMTIPNRLVAAGIAVWAAYVALSAAACAVLGQAACQVGNAVALQASVFAPLGFGPVASLVLDGLLGAFALGGGSLVLSLLLDALLGGQSLGGGDVKLLFVTGLFLGLPLGVFSLVLACVLGLVLSPLLKVPGGAFPFGPSIAAATVLTLLLGANAVGYAGLLG